MFSKGPLPFYCTFFSLGAWIACVRRWESSNPPLLPTSLRDTPQDVAWLSTTLDVPWLSTGGELPTVDSGSLGAVFRTMLPSLPLQQRSALTQLTVFPATFDDTAAAAVMCVDERRAHEVIKVGCFDERNRLRRPIWCAQRCSPKCPTLLPCCESQVCRVHLCSKAMLLVAIIISLLTGLCLTRFDLPLLAWLFPSPCENYF